MAHQRLTARGGVYVDVGLPGEISLGLDTRYLIENEVTIAGSTVGR